MTKRLMKGVSALATAAVLLFAGCSNINSGEISGGDTAAQSASALHYDAEGNAVVTAKINGLSSSAMVSELISRTVLPTPQAIEGDGLVYVLEGASYQGNTIEAQVITVGTSTEADGELTISFPDTSTWELTLTAYKTTGNGTAAITIDEATYSDPVLTATTEVSFTNGTPEITFNMNVKGLTTPGSVAIDSTAGFVYTGNSVQITKYEIALYDIITGAAIKTTSDTAATTGKVAVTTDAGTVNFTEDTTSLASVVPGEYVLGVTFYNTYNGNDYQVGFWSDYLVIAPGQTTDFKELITGIDEKPADPTNFKAELVAGSEANNTYLVKLTWDDNATNESNYEVDLYEVTDTAATTALNIDTIKATENATKLATLGFASLYTEDDAKNEKIVDFKDGSLYYGGGSLFASSETATLKLDTGKLYEVVIRAAKSASDKSADVARVENGTENVGYLAGKNHINRVRLSYIAAPYTITVGSTSAGQYVTYDIYKSEDISLLSDGFSLSYKGTASNFKGWISATDGKTEVTSTTYKNVTVLADVKIDVNALVNTYAYSTDVTSSFVALKAFTDDTDTGTDLSITNDVATVNATDNAFITVSAVDTEKTYKGYIIALDGILYAQENECTLYLNRMETGTHNIVVAGEAEDSTGNTTLYSYSFTLTIKR